MYRAVVFGVPGVLYPSIQEVFTAYETEHLLKTGCLEQARLANIDTWEEVELGDRTLNEFAPSFEKTTRKLGSFVDFTQVITSYLPAYQEMFSAADTLRRHEISTHVVTNSWLAEPGLDLPWNLDPFQQVLESASEGIRKPDERLYLLCCARSATAPDDMVVVDSDQESLDTADALGMRTIFIDPQDRSAALRELSELVDLALT